MNQSGRPLRALAGLGVALSVWIGLRLPAMQRDVVALAALAAPPVVVAQQPAPVVMAVPPARPLVLAAAPPARKVPPRPIPARKIAAIVTPAAALPLPPAAVPLPSAAGSSPSPAGRTWPADPAYVLAAQAYEALRFGQRRQAAALFDAALTLQPENPQWQAERRGLARRWQVGGYALLRDGGGPINQPGSGLPGFAATPVLGGGQMGTSVTWLADPYARRPLALTVRANAAIDAKGVRRETAQLAVGVRQTLLPGVSIAIERLVPLGEETQASFTARLAAGGRWQRVEAYGEAGVIDTGQFYAGGQARARLLRFGPATLNAATWASLQSGTPDVWRVDLGPAVALQFKGIRLEADWRQKVAGNAVPGSGPVLTISAGY